ncbi:MAG: cobalamin-binding protein [bacterium]|nr:cobalamin-binding protein [bacterium]
MADLNALRQAVINGDHTSARRITEEALGENTDPLQIVTGCLVPAMDEVGRLFEEEEYFIPEMLLAARAMKESMELIRPRLTATGAPSSGRAVIGAAKGDLHDIGKNLVASMLEGAGFDVHDLGVDVPPEKYVEAVKTVKPHLVCISTLLTTTMPALKKTIDAIDAAGLRDSVKIMVGGAPVTQQFADEIGADGYGENARSAVQKARELTARGAA